MRQANKLWIDTRLSEEEMNFLNVIIATSIERHAEDKEKEHEAGNPFRGELIDTDNWFFKTTIKKLSERMFYRDWDAYYKYVIDQEEPPPKFEMDSLWVNFQKKHDFVYLHNHTGCLYSFVIFVKIPTHWEEQHVKPPSSAAVQGAAVASDFQFAWTTREGMGMCETTNFSLSPEDEGRILFFPSWLHHQVYPFYGTEEDRITISGNIRMYDPNKLNVNSLFEGSMSEYEEKENVLKMLEHSVGEIGENIMARKILEHSARVAKEELKQMKKERKR